MLTHSLASASLPRHHPPPKPTLFPYTTLFRSIFSDQAIYDQEMEKIFGRAWLMIGHESLVPEVNDFFHTYMGEDPVILDRKSTRLNSSHRCISYAVFCLKKKNKLV